ncbi:MAG: Putative preQ0 transporter YhhQ, partial [uncultured Rubrobacteraceae bacterium]
VEAGRGQGRILARVRGGRRPVRDHAHCGEHNGGEARRFLGARAAGRRRCLSGELHMRGRVDGGLRVSDGAACDLARVLVQPARRGRHLPRADPPGRPVLAGPAGLRDHPGLHMASPRRLLPRLPHRRVRQLLHPREIEGRHERTLALEPHHRLHPRRPGPRFARLRLPRLRRDHPSGRHDLRDNRPVARQVSLRSPSHAADLRRSQPSKAHRGYRHLRSRHELQPAAGRQV